MLQRSPSYVISLPARDGLADRARRWLPEMGAYNLVRAKNVALQTLSFQLSRRRPRLMKALLQRGARSALPPGFDVATHFSPSYDPWDQRLCVCPDGDLFDVLSDGRASIVTDTVTSFTEDGMQLGSGVTLGADVIVTATGLRLQAIGGMQLVVDGHEVSAPRPPCTWARCCRGVPNFAFVMGYTNASWTLKADLTCGFVTRLLRHMRNRATPGRWRRGSVATSRGCRCSISVPATCSARWPSSPRRGRRRRGGCVRTTRWTASRSGDTTSMTGCSSSAAPPVPRPGRTRTRGQPPPSLSGSSSLRNGPLGSGGNLRAAAPDRLHWTHVGGV